MLPGTVTCTVSNSTYVVGGRRGFPVEGIRLARLGGHGGFLQKCGAGTFLGWGLGLKFRVLGRWGPTLYSTPVHYGKVA
jgi:hypothetical protein